MSQVLDSYLSKPTSVFEGQVKDIEYYETAKREHFVLCYIRGVEKPLAIPQNGNYPTPAHGEHISALDVTEGELFWFVGHRSVVTIKKPDFEVWRTPSKVDGKRREEAEALVLQYVEEKGSVTADDVCDRICDLFPERDRRIVGAIFLGLSKKGFIHKYGERPTERRNGHGSPIPVWHRSKKSRPNT